MRPDLANPWLEAVHQAGVLAAAAVAVAATHASGGAARPAKGVGLVGMAVALYLGHEAELAFFTQLLPRLLPHTPGVGR